MENKEIVERLKKVLKEYKERIENESDCSTCEEETPSSIQKCYRDTGEEPNACIECHRKEREAEDFVKQALNFIDKINIETEKKNDIPTLEALSPRDIKEYPFDALAVIEHINPKEKTFKVVKVVGYSSTVGWAIEIPNRKSFETMIFYRNVYKLSK